MPDVVPAHLGIFHDPVKVVDGDDPEPGYPSPTLQTVLAEHSPDILVSLITLSDILGGCLASVARLYGSMRSRRLCAELHPGLDHTASNSFVTLFRMVVAL